LNTNEPTGLRDKELRKYLEVDKKVDGADPKNPKHDFKNATMVVDAGSIKLPEDGKETQGEATGKFTLHGVTKDLPFSYKIKRTGSDLHARGSFTVNIESHGVKKPCLVEVCVKPDVEVKVKFKLREG
jgi:polyisoprenoid-binding protein YceI